MKYQRLDATGLYYYGARYYDAVIGRFTSPDTVTQSPANPQTINRYSYALNNPLRYIDPSGHYTFDRSGLGLLTAINPMMGLALEMTYRLIESFNQTTTVTSDPILLTAFHNGLSEPEPHNLEKIAPIGAIPGLIMSAFVLASLIPENKPLECIAHDVISLDSTITYNPILNTTDVELGINAGDSFILSNAIMKASSMSPLYIANDEMKYAGITDNGPALITADSLYFPFTTTFTGSVTGSPSINKLSALTVSFSVNADFEKTGVLPWYTLNSPNKITFNLLTGGVKLR